ncbi:hypothetical protein [Bacillus sp. 165]|uniref:anti-sigma factor family protein n=1 Tax=Bacillus sp. 165 TaxID=1529117 RepID=UPI001ADC989F|nr:hypothetical protein [Bacillus sp. 165]MBO9128976.1 hypothetical protein [Bacillus sp. 165]
MSHPTIEQLLFYHKNELSNEQKLLLAKHIEQCAVCQAELIFIEELEQEWNEADDIKLPPAIADNIMEKISGSNQKKYKQENIKIRLFHLSLAAAATFLFFHFGFVNYLTDTNHYVIQTIENTASLIEKGQTYAGKVSLSLDELVNFKGGFDGE